MGERLANSLRLRAQAKINLFLEVLGLRADGFHEIETVMVPISWSDSLIGRLNESGEIRFSWEADGGFCQTIPGGPSNLVVAAVEHLRQIAGTSAGLDIHLVKRIPTEAGLGGASSNAAAALTLANTLWGLHWPRTRLAQIAANIGSDVPFFLWNRPARCIGRGEQVVPIRAAGGLPLVVVQPPRGLSTSAVYNRVDGMKVQAGDLRKSNELLRSLANSRLNQIALSIFNRLESAAASILEEIDVARRAFRKTSALAFQMSGSGACCFGLYGSRRAAELAAARLARLLPGFRVVTCLTSGSV